MSAQPPVCRGCAGTGIGPQATPREVQIALRTIHMVKRWPSEFNGVKTTGEIHAKSKVTSEPIDNHADSRDSFSATPPNTRETRAHARVDNWEGIGGVHKGRLAMSGPLLHVIEHVRSRIEDGYQLERGSWMPDRKLLCPWCGGAGVSGKILTAHTMAEALEMGGGND